MSDVRAAQAGHAAPSPVSPQALVAIAEDAVAEGDLETAIRFNEVVYQAFDEALDVPPLELAA